MSLWREPARATAPLDEAAAADARAVCEVLGIPHQVVDLRDPFYEQVVRPFVRDYAAGRTPNPCLRLQPRAKVRRSAGAGAGRAAHSIWPRGTMHASAARATPGNSCAPPTRARTSPTCSTRWGRRSWAACSCRWAT